MSTRAERIVWMPGWGAWMVLVALIAAGLATNWLVAAVLLILALRQMARPLDFMTSVLIVVGGASFVRYEGGYLTRELAVLSGLILLMLFAYVVSHRDQWAVLPRTSLLAPILVFVGLTLVNYARGVFGGMSPRYATLDLLPILGLASSLVVGNAFDPRKDLRLATGGLLVVGYGMALLGYYFFGVYHQRAGGVFFMPMPGMVAMLAVNLALRSRGTASALVWTSVALPLLLHQFISFTRGYWLGCAAGLLASFVMYVRWGRGAGPGWWRAGLVFGALVGMGAVGGLVLGMASGQDLLGLAARRFGSIGGTSFTHETASNLARLTEYAEAIRQIAVAPWLGHGLGSTVMYREPIGFTVTDQWFVHQIYLYVWLKQGLVGLLAFLWMLTAVVVFCARRSRLRVDPAESAWLAATAACTVLLGVVNMSNFHLAQVNSTFPLALLWGGAMAIGREGFIRFRWADGGPGRDAGPEVR